MVVTRAADHLQPRRQFDLVLQINRPGADLRCAGADQPAETERGQGEGARQRDGRGLGGSAAEHHVAALCGAVLFAKFHPGKQRVADIAGAALPHQIGLPDPVIAGESLAVTGQCDRGGGGCAGQHVGIKFVVSRKLPGRIEGQTFGQFVRDPGAGKVRVDGAVVKRRAAKECAVIARDRPVNQRRHAAIDDPVIAVVFVRQGQLGPLAQRDCQSGRHADEFAAEKVAVVVQLLVCPGQPQRSVLSQRQIAVAAQRPGAKAVRPAGQRSCVLAQLGHFADPVNRPAAAAAAEQQRVRALEHLDPLDVEQRAIILRIIAHPIEEEIGGAGLPAQDNLIAVAFALAQRDPRDIPQSLAQTEHGLIIEPRAVERDHALRRIDQRHAGLGCADVDFVQPLGSHDDWCARAVGVVSRACCGVAGIGRSCDDGADSAGCSKHESHGNTRLLIISRNNIFVANANPSQLQALLLQCIAAANQQSSRSAL